MLFSQQITLPANTAQADAIEQEIKLAPGVITKIEVQFPPGPFGLSHIQLLQDTHQFAPFDPTQDIASDRETVTWSEEIILNRPPYKMAIRGWNDDTAFPHIITVRISTRPLKPQDGPGGEIPEELRRLLFEE